jgi:hypothetical protein
MVKVLHKTLSLPAAKRVVKVLHKSVSLGEKGRDMDLCSIFTTRFE